jgi:hypothetical protein
MVDAALTGDGFERMAELAADEIGRPVAIVIPEREIAVLWPDLPNLAPLDELVGFVADRACDRAGQIPSFVGLLVPVTFEHEFQGGVAMLSSAAEAPEDAGEFLHLAAMAASTALALEQARELESAQSRDGPIEELIAGRIDGREAAARVAERGCELEDGFCGVVADAGTSRPHQALASVQEAFPGAICELIDDRIYALAPAVEAGGYERVRGQRSTAISTSYVDPAELAVALHEAELIVDARIADAEFAGELDRQGGAGVYGLLFRVLASRPDEVRGFYRDTIEPAARYDEQYGADLVATLESYLANDCNMNATAKAIHAHRHTVAYRLDRVKELTGLDPSATEDREQLGLGLKAMRVSGATA